LESVAKIVEESKTVNAEIKSLKANPAYMPEEDIKALARRTKEKIKSAFQINTDISKIASDPKFVDSDEVVKLREAAAKETVECGLCKKVINPDDDGFKCGG
jgi:uncharacterized protein YlaI